MISPEQLRRYPFFGGLTDDELAAIAMVADEVAYPAGAIIFREGELARHVYVLTSGAVDLLYEIHRPDGMDISYLGAIAAGEPFGVSAFVEPYKLTATARAEGPVKVLALDASALRKMADTNCHLGYALMKQAARSLAGRLSDARIQLAACR
jgi:CRP-like cAMP-binding protein